VLDGLVITHDSIAEGIHFLSTDPPASVGWKLVAVNLSDIAAKGATPRGALLSLTISGADDWEDRFLGGVEAACESYALPLIGGDTIALPSGAARVLGMTAIGCAGSHIPDRAGGRPGDRLWVIGTLGDSAAGLDQLRADPKAASQLVDIYRRPIPQLGAGQLLAPHAHAMMDVSDGLLLDVRRIAEASNCAAEIDLDAIPLSDGFIEYRGAGLDARLFAATAGDDYALLAALPPELAPSILSLPEGTTIACVGSLVAGDPGIAVVSGGHSIELPEVLGFEHKGNQHRPGSGPPVADRP
jgi:thiamine-monophosphate kinase